MTLSAQVPASLTRPQTPEGKTTIGLSAFLDRLSDHTQDPGLVALEGLSLRKAASQLGISATSVQRAQRQPCGPLALAFLRRRPGAFNSERC